MEYKYKKQEYLIRVDYETVCESKKENQITRFNEFYVSKMDVLYKGLLKNYSVQLADKLNSEIEDDNDVYGKIFNSLERYIEEVLPLKLKTEKESEYKNIIEEYERYEEVTIGKLDVRDDIKKKVVLLGLSRFLFTHSLPLVAAEECYLKLIKDARRILVEEKGTPREEKNFELLAELIEEYNVKLLSTKVYWDRPEEREEYKEFWNKYKEISKLDEEEAKKEKQILFIKNDLKNLNRNIQNTQIVQVYKEKLVEFGVMRSIKNSCTSEGIYIKKENTQKKVRKSI